MTITVTVTIEASDELKKQFEENEYGFHIDLLSAVEEMFEDTAGEEADDVQVQIEVEDDEAIDITPEPRNP